MLYIFATIKYEYSNLHIPKNTSSMFTTGPTLVVMLVHITEILGMFTLVSNVKRI